MVRIMAKQSKYSIVIPVGMRPRPKIHEETAAEILAHHFKCDVYFLETGSQGTPDVSIKGTTWEIKSPVGEYSYRFKAVKVASNTDNRLYQAIHRQVQETKTGFGHHKVQANIDNDNQVAGKLYL